VHQPPTMYRPTPIDAYPTATSYQQADTEIILQDHVPLEGSTGGCVLNKNRHLELLVRNLAQGFPARYVSQDASQPWLMFWTLQSFSALQIGIDPDTKQRCLSFCVSLCLPSPVLKCFAFWRLGQSILS
jgi:protein farnesyltransferase subunit beta